MIIGYGAMSGRRCGGSGDSIAPAATTAATTTANIATTTTGATTTMTLGDLEDGAMHHRRGDDLDSGSPTRRYRRDDDEDADVEHRRDDRPRRAPGGLARINLDLSGRIVCHVFSRGSRRRSVDDDGEQGLVVVMGGEGGEGGGGGWCEGSVTTPRGGSEVRRGRRMGGWEYGGGSSAPLFSLPSRPSSSSSSTTNETKHGIRRSSSLLPLPPPATILPHDVYLGANYDLDEVWYGATRWIARLTWIVGGGGMMIKATRGGGTSVVDPSSYSSSSILRTVRDSAYALRGRVFPHPLTSSSISTWTIDVDAERSVFDRSDVTCRLRLAQSPVRSSSSASSRGAAPFWAPRHISLDYDSAKYYDNDGYGDDGATTTTAERRDVLYAPIVSLDACTPLFHPRLEVSARRTWVLGGSGNAYHPPCVVRRFEAIREKYRDGIPRSDPTEMPTSGCATGRNTLARRISAWLENDGWMPRRVSADLMGNFVSVSEVGFPCEGDASSSTGRLRPSSSSTRRAGLRLRLSKRIDWTTLGIFPWSDGGGNKRDGGDGYGGGWLDSLLSTRARLELCGLCGAGGDSRASVGFDVDPSDWAGTFKITVHHEDVSIL